MAQLRKAETRRSYLSAAAALASAAMVFVGCAAQKKPAIPWRTAVLVRPVAPQKPIEDAAQIPDLNLEVPAPPEPLAVTRTGPARPHLPSPAVNRGDTPPAKLDVPPIVPELSVQESNELQRETELSLGNAERNIAAASRKPLNATQSDLASKVRGFISDAHEAGRVGDWPRARDLAKKAQVLSEELANSL